MGSSDVTTGDAPTTTLDCGCRYDHVDADGHYCQPGRGHHCRLECRHGHPPDGRRVVHGAMPTIRQTEQGMRYGASCQCGWSDPVWWPTPDQMLSRLIKQHLAPKLNEWEDARWKTRLIVDEYLTGVDQ